MKFSLLVDNKKLSLEQLKKLDLIENSELNGMLSKYVQLMEPSSIFVVTDSEEDRNYVKSRSLLQGEETLLRDGIRTYHYDNYYDQARDKENTKVLTPHGEDLPFINSMARGGGLKDIEFRMKGIMKGKEMVIGFFSEGPDNSPLSLKAVQVTDSYYVMHSELILYRSAFKYFATHPETEFLKFVHSQGEVDKRKTSINLSSRRIYFDLEGNSCVSINTQYAGNTVGLKKPAFRITIHKAMNEGWLSEHMFLMGINGPNGRVTYVSGAFPSASGKTSTCMVGGERIVGDDLVFIREDRGVAKAINLEVGVFGIIDGINETDDSAIWKVMHGNNEVVFSNILVTAGEPFWNGMGTSIPDAGENHSGNWKKGDKDKNGAEILPSHKNARFTVSLSAFPNLDYDALNGEGVPLEGIIFGGRDSDTWPPVTQSFYWNHGVVAKGASIESESTAASLGKVGVRTFNAMAIMEFLSVDLGKYLRNYIDFGKKLKRDIPIFGVNYFLKEDGKFLNEKTDKAVWLKWMDLRIHGEIDAVRTPIGFIPRYYDLRELFRNVLGREYREQDYLKQFSVRISKLLEKNERIRNVYANIPTTPAEVLEELEKEEQRLKEFQEKFGETASPLDIEG